MSVAYINIGSNQGDSHAVIEQAIALIEFYSRSAAVRSDYITTAPWGFESQNEFLNIGIAIDWDKSPLELLDTLQRIERTISPSPHRDADGLYIDRVIDIDIIAIDEEIINTERLTVPHPRMHLREFVLKPMHQIAPGWRHPMLAASPKELIERLGC